MSLKMQSSAAYDNLRSSGFITMPSERTLNDYIHFYKAAEGFYDDLDAELSALAKVDTLSYLQRHVALSFDEMRVREDLLYDKASSRIIGCVHLGDVNDGIADLDRTLRGGGAADRKPIATHMLVIMIRGITTTLRFPYAHFPTSEVTASYLYDIVWEAIRRIESIGLKVASVTCDGAATNKKFFRLCTSSQSQEKSTHFKCRNPYSEDDCPLYFFSDVPHLIKTTRNCWSHSYVGSKRRAMRVRHLATFITLV